MCTMHTCTDPAGDWYNWTNPFDEYARVHHMPVDNWRQAKRRHKAWLTALAAVKLEIEAEQALAAKAAEGGQTAT